MINLCLTLILITKMTSKVLKEQVVTVVFVFGLIFPAYVGSLLMVGIPSIGFQELIVYTYSL